MEDKVPSALLDSTNSFDSIFALELDTRQRFDNAMSGIQKPIDYPIPEYNSTVTPNGLSQHQLLNPDITKGTLGEALFSPDRRIADYAVGKMKHGQETMPINHNIGVPDRFQYDKSMDKYLRGDFGYNPYMSIEENEDFNYRHDYMNHTLVGRILRNVGTGVTRFVASVGLKLGQTAGHMGSMVGNGVQELFEAAGGPENNFMADVADNSLSRWFEQQEEDMKNSPLLSVFKPHGWDDMGFFKKLGHGGFWTDEVADGAAFMGEMVASMYILGGLGKIGVIGRFGATPINMASKFGKVGKGLDAVTKLATGADNISGIGRWAFSVASESAFEASQVYKTRKDELRKGRDAGLNNFSDQEIEVQAGDAAAASFKANSLLLSASNAFENRFIFTPIFKRRGAGFDRPDPRSSMIDVSGKPQVDDFLKASRKEYDYSTWLGKKIDWKNPNARLRFYGSRALGATGMEGLWEENAQLATERLASSDNLSFRSFFKKFGKQTVDAILGDDPEASTSIGLGAIIGAGGTTAAGKVGGGDRLFEGERRKRETDTQIAIDSYNAFRDAFMSYNDIYAKDANGKPIKKAPNPDGSDSGFEIDKVKALGLMDGTMRMSGKLAALDKISDPLFRKHLQDDAMADFIWASKKAGVYGKVLNKFKNLDGLDQDNLANLGFDPTSVVDAPYLKKSVEDMGQIYEKAMYARPVKRGKGDTAINEESRKRMLYKSMGRSYSATKIGDEYQKQMMDIDSISSFAPEAVDKTASVQEYNSLVYQEASLKQFLDLPEDDFYKEFGVNTLADIRKKRNALLNTLIPLVQKGDLTFGFEGLAMSPARFRRMTGKIYVPKNIAQPEGAPDLTDTTELSIHDPDALDKVYKAILSGIGYTTEEFNKKGGNFNNLLQARFNFDKESRDNIKLGEMRNTAAQYDYITDKITNPEKGMENFKKLKGNSSKVQEVDEEMDEKDGEEITPLATVPAATTTPPVTPVVTPSAPVATGPVPAPEKATKKEVKDSSTFADDLAKRFDKAYQTHLDREPTEYNDLVDLINSHIQDESDIIKHFFFQKMEPARKLANSGPVANDNPIVNEFIELSSFINNLNANGLNEDLVDELFAQMDAIDDKFEFTEAGEVLPEPVVTPSEESVDNTQTIQDNLNQDLGITSPIIKSVYLAGLHYVQTEDGKFYVIPDSNSGRPEAAIEVTKDEIIKPFRTTSEWNELRQSQESTGVTLNDAELAAIEGLKGKQLTGALEMYNIVLQDPASTPANKKDALKAISDQLLAPVTEATTGEQLGRAADLIYNLGYTAPAETEALSSLASQQASISASSPVVEAMKKDIEERRKAEKKALDEASGNIIPLDGPEMQAIDAKYNAELAELEKAISQQTKASPTTQANAELSKEKTSVNNTPILKSSASNFEVLYIPRTVYEQAYANDKINQERIGGAQTLDRIIQRGGYTIEELDKLLPQWRDIAASQQTELPPTTEPVALEPDTGITVTGGSATATTQAQDSKAKRNENQVRDTETPTASIDLPPISPENVEDDSSEARYENELDVYVNKAKLGITDDPATEGRGFFTFVTNYLEEIASIGEDSVKLKTLGGDQSEQLLRTHNTLKRMSSPTQEVNFFSTDDRGNRTFRIKLVQGREEVHQKWIYRTDKGKLDKFGNPFRFPVIIAVITDRAGKPIYFDSQGNPTDKAGGQPVAFPYSVEEYRAKNLDMSRKGALTGSGEPLNGAAAYLNDDPLEDIRNAVFKGVEVFGEIRFVTAGKLSSTHVTNKAATQALAPEEYKKKTVKEMKEKNYISPSSPVVVKQGNYFVQATDYDSANKQQLKLGQPYVFDKKSGYYISLKGKTLRELTVDGQPLLNKSMIDNIEGLRKDKELRLDFEDFSAENIVLMDQIYEFIRALVYSENTWITRSEDKTQIFLTDNRPNTGKSLLDEEVNFSLNIEGLGIPYANRTISYGKFVEENFQSGALPAEIEKGVTRVEKLNKRMVFTLDMFHDEILNSIGASTLNVRTVKTRPQDMKKFVGKTFKRLGSGRVVTVTAFEGGVFTVSTAGGVTTTKTQEEFTKEIQKMEEVITPEPSDETKQALADKMKLSKDTIDDLINKSKDSKSSDLRGGIDLSCD